MTQTYATAYRVPNGFCEAVTCGTFVKPIDREIIYATPEEATAMAERHLKAAERLRDRRHRHARLYGISVVCAIPIVLVFSTLSLWGEVEASTRVVSAAIAIGTLIVLGLVSARRNIPENVAQYLDAAKVSKP